MTNNLWIELSDNSAQNVSGGFDFGPSSFTSVKFNSFIASLTVSQTRIDGNTAMGESDNVALGRATYTNGVVINKAVQGEGSSTIVTGIAAVN